MPSPSFVPFDPARVCVRVNHRYSTTQGSLTIAVDGKDVLTIADDVQLRPVDLMDPHGACQWRGYTQEQQTAIVKRLWERGSWRSNVKPLWGGEPYLSVDSDDVLRLPNVEGRDLFMHAESPGVMNFYDLSAGPTQDGDGTLIASKALNSEPDVDLWSADGCITLSQDPLIKIGSVEWAACKKFMSRMAAEEEIERTIRLRSVMPGEEFKSKIFACVQESQYCKAELAALADYMNYRGKPVRIHAASGVFENEPEWLENVTLADMSGSFTLQRGMVAGSILRNWATDPDLEVDCLSPIWKGRLSDEDLGFNNGLDADNVVVYPARYYADGSVADEGFARQETKDQADTVKTDPGEALLCPTI